MQREQHILASLYGKKTVVPKGTADLVMERLFPTRRSEVPTDDERKQAVYVILLEVGAFEVKEILNEQANGHEDGIGQGENASEGSTSAETEEVKVA